MHPCLFMLPLLTLTAGLDCGSTAQCNRLGSEALQAERHDDAISYFQRQVDYAETALRQSEIDANGTRLQHAREIAVNNMVLAKLRVGKCGKARAWLQVADVAHRATQANLRSIEQRCSDSLPPDKKTGEFWQYAGHGAWNSISIRTTGDETLEIEAFWMRIARGPFHDWGPAAFGNIESAFLHIEENTGRGRFEALDPATECELAVSFRSDGLEVSHTDSPDCKIGGAGAHLSGRYWRVGDASERAEE